MIVRIQQITQSSLSTSMLLDTQLGLITIVRNVLKHLWNLVQSTHYSQKKYPLDSIIVFV